jgi:hypothetical protein
MIAEPRVGRQREEDVAGQRHIEFGIRNLEVKN